MSAVASVILRSALARTESRGAHFRIPDVAHQRSGVDVVARFEPVLQLSAGRSVNRIGPQHVHQFRARGGISKGCQSRRGIAADHGLRIVDQPQQGFVEGCIGGVLAHHPRGRFAQLQVGAGGLPNDLGIPAGDVFMPRQAVAELHQRVLRMAGLGRVREISIQVARRERTAKPGVIPEQKRKQHQQQGEERDEQIGFGPGTFGAVGHQRVIIALQGLLPGL